MRPRTLFPCLLLATLLIGTRARGEDKSGDALAVLYGVGGTAFVCNVVAGSALLVTDAVGLARKRSIRGVGIADIVVGTLNIGQGAATIAIGYGSSDERIFSALGATNLAFGIAGAVLGALSVHHAGQRRVGVTPAMLRGPDPRENAVPGFMVAGRF